MRDLIQRRLVQHTIYNTNINLSSLETSPCHFHRRSSSSREASQHYLDYLGAGGDPQRQLQAMVGAVLHTSSVRPTQ